MFLRSLVFGAVLAALSFGGTAARADDDDAPPYREGDAVPEGYHVERSNAAESLATAGGVALVAAYIPAFFGGMLGGLGCMAGYCDPNPAWLFVPVVGPFKVSHDASRSDPSPGTGANLLVMDGMVQTAGAGLLLIGALAYVAATPHLVPNRASNGASVHVVPLLAGGTTGLALGGTF